LPAVQRRHRALRLVVEDREVELVDVEMQDVELACRSTHLVEHHHVVGNDVADGRIEPQRLRAAGHQSCRGDRLPAGE
jgi:hypothetical protein